MGGTGASLGSVAAKKKAAKVWVSGAEHPPRLRAFLAECLLAGIAVGMRVFTG